MFSLPLCLLGPSIALAHSPFLGSFSIFCVSVTRGRDVHVGGACWDWDACEAASPLQRASYS